MSEISLKLRQLRVGKNFTQKAVAAALGIKQQTYSNYERGKREIPVCHIPRLAKLYRVSADLILDIPASYEGSTDLSTPYIRHVTLAELVGDLQSLQGQDRIIAAYYIHLMRKYRGNGAIPPHSDSGQKKDRKM